MAAGAFALVGAAAWLWLRPPTSLPTLEPREAELLTPAAAQAEPTSPSLEMAHGWSTQKGTAAAVAEAMSRLSAPLKSVNFVVVFFTSPHAPAEIRDGIRRLAPDTRIFGMQSANGVFSSEGLHHSPDGAIALLGFSSETLRVGVAGGGLNDDIPHAAIARRVLAAAQRDAGKTPQDSPSAIITGQVLGHSEEYCSAINEGMPKNTPVIGGNAITSDVKLGAVIANDKVFDSGFVAALLYAEKPVGTYFHGGFAGRMKHGIVTAIDPQDSHVVVQIDHRPAIEVYDEWSKGEFREYIDPQRTTVVNSTVLKPLAKALPMANGEVHYLALHPWRFHANGSMSVGVEVLEGDKLHYVEGSQESLVERSGVVTRRALADGRISEDQLAGGIHIYCVGAGMNLGISDDGLVPQMIEEIKSKTGNAPFIGGFFGGEQGSIRDHGVFAGNLMSSMMVFSE